MKAKFNGTCRECGGHIEVGDDIRWSRAEGARHADQATCDELSDMYAEMRAEQRFELGTQYSALVREYGFDGV